MNAMDYGLVSVIMPTYNCGRYIEEAVRSVIAQTYGNWELIIVDDMSCDGTPDILRPYTADPRIRYMRNERNMGAALTRNRALREARGRWVAFLDSDDVWLPEKLGRQLAFMTDGGYAFTYHEYLEMDEASRLSGVHVSGRRRVGRWGMRSCCWPGCLTVMYDADRIGLVQIADIRKDNDSAMWLQVSRKADCHLLPCTLALYRRRRGSITPPSLLAKIGWHYVLFRKAAGMNPVGACFWMGVNVVCNAYKKMRYVTRRDLTDIPTSADIPSRTDKRQ